MPDLDAIRENAPACLRELPQWVCWQYIERDGKRTKAPINPATGAFADSTNPATWSDFDTALSACNRFSALAGVGFVFTLRDRYCGVDLDDCIDTETGEMTEWGGRIIRSLNSYTEISPSGSGVKIFVRASKPGKRCKTAYKSGDVEMYDHDRFFTVTGAIVGDIKDVVNRHDQIAALYAEVFCERVHSTALPPETVQSTPLTDDEIIRLASSARRMNGAKLTNLFEGNWNAYFNSPSEADSSVCWTLAYYTKDAAQIDRIFRRSGLLRPKWDETHGEQTYGEMTIAKALAGVTKQYVKRKRASHPASPPKPAPSLDGEPADPLPPLYQPDEVARTFLDDNSRIIYWRGIFHLYTATHYRVMAEAELGARIAAFITEIGWWTRPAKKVGKDKYEDGAVPHPDYGNLMVVLVKVVPKTGDIREIILQLKIDYLTDTANTPMWMAGEGRPPATELVACSNGLLHLPTSALHEHSDKFFSLNAVEFDYAPDAPAPTQWLRFLDEVFTDDADAIDTLQEMFGYYLLPDTRQQKIGLLVGPKRSGKGTIGRVLTAMLGRANVCGPTLGSLCTNFGLWPLLDKPLAIISDARLSGRADQAVVVERLLSISGEDTITVDRKHLAPWTGTLPTRFLILTNELPRLADASGALAGRFIVLCLTRSWYGREDMGLTDKLLEELPGVFNWAIEGWRRLRERGYFIQPMSSREAMRQLEDLGSPIAAFLRERCEVGADKVVEASELFAAWQAYCHEGGRVNAGTIQSFGRDLRAALPSLKTTQPRIEGGRTRFYEGVGLARAARMARVAPHCGKHSRMVG